MTPAHASPAGRLGHPRRHLRETDSTNLRARELAATGAPHGTVVTAAHQTAGRGRQGRRWEAPAGRALLMSMVVRGPDGLLSLRAGVAVAAAAQALDAGRRVAAVKWPNDVLLEGDKVAGILVEGRPRDDWAVVGIGLNVAVAPGDLPDSVAERATSLRLGPAEVETALSAVLGELARTLSAPAAGVLSELRGRDALRGQPVRWVSGDGVAAGIDDAGRLRVAAGGRILTLDAGEVHLAATAGTTRCESPER